MRRVLERIVTVFSSFKLAVGLFIALLVVVLIGTLEQQYMSLFDVQTKYFESLFFTYRLFGAVTVPFPGGVLLLGVLLLNLSIGGLMRMRFSRAKAGVLIVHFGIVFLLVGGFVEFRWSNKGFMKLYEGEHGARFQSYEDLDLAIVRAGPEPKEWFVPSAAVVAAQGESTVTVNAPDLPFKLVLTGYARHTKVRGAEAMSTGIDGVELVGQSEPAGEGVNVPGLLATIVPLDTSAAPVRGYVRASVATIESTPAYALNMKAAGAVWNLALVRRSWPVPFETRLDRFVHKEYPGTEKPKEFSSYVAVTDGGLSRDVHITMNEPLRLRGVTLYQSQWGRDERGLYSVFAVVHNPTDQVPKWACWVIFIGMVVHFGSRLMRHLRAERNRRAAIASPDSTDPSSSERSTT